MSPGKWQARIYSGKGYIHLGTFGSPELAAKEYRAASRILHGEFAFNPKTSRTRG